MLFFYFYGADRTQYSGQWILVQATTKCISMKLRPIPIMIYAVYPHSLQGGGDWITKRARNGAKMSLMLDRFFTHMVGFTIFPYIMALIHKIPRLELHQFYCNCRTLWKVKFNVTPVYFFWKLSNTIHCQSFKIFSFLVSMGTIGTTAHNTLLLPINHPHQIWRAQTSPSTLQQFLLDCSNKRVFEQDPVSPGTSTA